MTVNICGDARGAATRETASLETPEKASVEEARRYIILDGETAAETGDFDDVADGAGAGAPALTLSFVFHGLRAHADGSAGGP